MLGILKNLFGKEREQIKEQELDTWLDKKISTLKDELTHELTKTNQHITSGIAATKAKLEALEQGSLLNPEIPERAKHFMKGNKEEFSRRVTQFLQSLFLAEDLEQFEQFKLKTQEALQELLEGIKRPQQILNEFLANETRETNQALSLIESAIAKFADILSRSIYFELIAIRTALHAARETQEKRAIHTKELVNTEEAIQTLEAVSKKLKEEVALLQKAKALTDLQAQQASLAEQKKVLEQQLHQKFSIVETALRKYSHIAVHNKNLCDAYLTDPVKATTQDLHLAILNVLYDMKKAIERNVLDLKDKKKSKTLDELSEINKEYLGTFLTEYGRITKEQKIIAADIDGLDVTTLIKIKKDKIIENTGEVIQKQARVKKLQKELEKTDGVDPKKELQRLEKVAGISII